MEFQLLNEVRGVLDVLERTTGEPGDLNSALQHIAQTAQTFFSADDCVIFAMNPITNRFIASLTIAGDLLERNVPFEQPRPAGLAREVLRRGVLVVEDLEAMPEYQSTFTRLEDIRSFVGLAMYMKHRQKPLGVVYLNFREPQQFSSDTCELFQLFADQASYILQETWLLQRYQEVARIGQEINHELSTAYNLFQKLQKYVGDILDTSYALLLAVYQPQTSTLDLYLDEEGHSIFLQNDPLEGACQYVIETLKPLFIRQISKEAETLPFKPVEIITEAGSKESLIFVPLVSRDMPLGVLSIQHPQSNAYNQEDLFILQLLANHIALALNNIRLYNSLNHLNETGQLLTQQLDSEQVLQTIADNIREATKADIVVLYPYEPLLQHFVLPPRMAGTLLDLFSRQYMSPSRPDDIASLLLPHTEPIFAKESHLLYTQLHGNVHIRQGRFQERENIRSVAALPLRVGEQSVGVLFVNFRQLQRFDASQKLLIEGLAHYAAIAIKNAQAFGTLAQRRMRELEILQNIDRELNRTLNLESLLNTLLKLANEQVHAEEASILLYNSRIQALEIPAAIGPNAEDRLTHVISLKETKYITRWVLEHKNPARVDNVYRDSQWRDLYIPASADTISELDVPLLDGEEVIGVLNFESTREHAFHQEDEHFLLTLAGQAVLAIKNAQVYEREKRLAEEGRVLNQISKEITSQLDPAHVFDLILEKALELTHSTSGALLLYNSDLNDLMTVAARGMAEDKKSVRLSLQQGIVGHVAAQKQLCNVRDVSQHPWNEIYIEFLPGTLSELAVPMLAGNELRGVLNVESRNPNNFSESDARLLQGLADLAVVALQNAQAYEREKRLAAEAQVLNEISKEITSQLDPIHVFDFILEKALELTNSHMGNLMLYDRDQNDLWMAAERGVAKDKKGKRHGLDQGIVGYAAKNKQLLNVMDVSQYPWNEIFLEYILETRSEIAVPLLVGDEIRGVLNVESPAPHNFSERDERLLQGLADLAVVALQNAQAYDREKRLVAEAQVLNEISKQITSQLDLNHVFDLILEKALDLTHSNLGNLMLYDRDQNDLWMAAERGIAKNKKGLRQRLGQGIVGQAAINRQLLNVDLSRSPWNEIYLEFFPGACSELAVPMLAGNELRGVLNVESPKPNNFGESDERLLQGLADLAVVALQNAERYEKAEKEAQRFTLLYQAGQELSKITDLTQLELAYETVLHIAEKQSQSLVVIRRYDKDAHELEVIRASQPQYPGLYRRTKLDVGINGQVARERRTIVIHDINNPSPGVVPAQASDTTARSRLITPISFEEQYYGNLGLNHKDVGHFQGADILFFEGLAHQLASTIHRLETVQERQEFEQRALTAEEMSSIGQSAFEVTHRLGNDLGLVESYITDIRTELAQRGMTNGFVSRKLDNILKSVKGVLSFSGDLKQELAKLGAKEEMAGEPVVISSRLLLEEVQATPSLPSNISIRLEIDNDVAAVRGIHSLVADILRNLVANAIQALPKGGTITLRGQNTGRYVALEVSDTGIGIPSGRLSKIFGLFFSTKGSSGFGLWSARRNALRNHGELKVDSKLGQGTTFTLLLPRADIRNNISIATEAYSTR